MFSERKYFFCESNFKSWFKPWISDKKQGICNSCSIPFLIKAPLQAFVFEVEKLFRKNETAVLTALIRDSFVIRSVKLFQRSGFFFDSLGAITCFWMSRNQDGRHYWEKKSIWKKRKIVVTYRIAMEMCRGKKQCIAFLVCIQQPYLTWRKHEKTNGKILRNNVYQKFGIIIGQLTSTANIKLLLVINSSMFSQWYFMVTMCSCNNIDIVNFKIVIFYAS